MYSFASGSKFWLRINLYDVVTTTHINFYYHMHQHINMKLMTAPLECHKNIITENKFQGLWVNFAKDQLFCLLGPNGAGKTTSISCLTGITPVTGGDGNVISTKFYFLDIMSLD